MKRAIAIELLVLMPVIGCAGCGSRLVGSSQQWVLWSHGTAGTEPVPGIDQAHLIFGHYGDGYALMVWSDTHGGSFGSSWDSTRKAAHYQGHVSSTDGRRVPVECFTSDGTTGTVTIGDGTFQLRDGSLFLVSTSGRKTKVKQLNRSVPMLKSETGEWKVDPLKEMAKNDAEIRAFFEESRKSP